MSYGCPWAQRTLIVRTLKRLDPLVSVSVVEPTIGPQGWAFGNGAHGTTDTLYGHRYLHELYTRAQPSFTGIVTVPVLWDRRKRTIVNNESSEIMRMFNTAFDACGGDATVDLYPEPLRPTIDALKLPVRTEPDGHPSQGTGAGSPSGRLRRRATLRSETVSPLAPTRCSRLATRKPSALAA